MTQTSTGWILDVYIEENDAVIWIKTKQGQVLRLIDDYEPVSTYNLRVNSPAQKYYKFYRI